MKILFITDLYPISDKEKLTPRTLCAFVEQWRKLGHTVDVIKPNFILNSFIRKKPFYKTKRYNDVININYWTPFWFDIKNKLKKFNIDFKSYDITVAHMPSGILFADKLNVSFAAGVHISDIEVLSKPFYKYTGFSLREKRAIVNAKKIACRSLVLKDKLSKLIPECKDKMFTALSGIDEYYIKSDFTDKTFDSSNRLKVVTCANLITRKNIDKVILALRELKGFQLTVIGDGKLRKKLEKLDRDVIFTGYLEHNSVLDIMKNSDIFILPSINETFGMVYLEAIASGCITICTKGDGVSGIIQNEITGFEVEPTVEDIQKCFEKIKSMEARTLNTIRVNAFKTIKNLASDVCAEEYLQQIFKIL